MDARDLDMLGMNLAEVGTEPTNIVKNCNDKPSGSDDYSYKSAEVGTEQKYDPFVWNDNTDGLIDRAHLLKRLQDFVEWCRDDRLDGTKFCIDVIKDEPSAQPEPCEDAVSRRRLLNDLKDLTAAWKEYPIMEEQIKGVEAAIGYLKRIPSTQSMWKNGKWRRISADKYVQHAYAFYRCSECGLDSLGEHNFCPNCGCQMTEGEQK